MRARSRIEYGRPVFGWHVGFVPVSTSQCFSQKPFRIPILGASRPSFVQYWRMCPSGCRPKYSRISRQVACPAVLDVSRYTALHSSEPLTCGS